jgi:hypothetical protein
MARGGPFVQSQFVLLVAALFGVSCGSGGGPAVLPAPTCADYCALVQTACAPDHQQYSDMDDCLASCEAFPVGEAADTSGDTLGCRLAYARTAARGPSQAAMHCAHAGPGGAGTCGANCEGYCDIAMMYCSEAHGAKLYDTRAACLTDCALRADDVMLNAGAGVRTDMGNTTACLLYHAQMGSVAPSGHCLGDLAIVGGACHSEE